VNPTLALALAIGPLILGLAVGWLGRGWHVRRRGGEYQEGHSDGFTDGQLEALRMILRQAARTRRVDRRRVDGGHPTD
jgi:hypothetical protein